jgi:putative endonuclease
MREYCVYILRCADDSFYIGVTNNLERRFEQHQAGIDPKCYTFKRRPLKVVHVERFSEVVYAINREKQLKRWSRRKKEALIAGNEYGLMQAAARRQRYIRKS